MLKLVFSAAILFVALLVGCSKYESENKADEGSQVQFGESECTGGDDEDPLPSLRGTVTDTATLDSLMGVCVKLTTDADVFVAVIGTDSNGHYYFNQVANGSYKLVFTKTGYVTKTIPTSISSSPITLDAQLRQTP
ncbi:MAG: carboxypeptidase-like regulatory domain-containing protein [Bacteroidia bacterium]